MNSVKDKRKANRIQGGWNKGKDTTKPNCKIEFVPEGPSADLIPEFDNMVVRDIKKKCIITEIKNSISLDLNKESSIVELSDAIPASIDYKKEFLSPDESSDLFKYFLNNLPWEQRENATPSGQKFLEPRQTCWYGLPYSYSKVKMPPNQNWDPKLKELMNSLQSYSNGKPFNSVMCNLYMGAKNSIDWHADDEVHLGKNPTIASISLGSTRVFEMCYRKDLYHDYKNKERNPFSSRIKDEPPFEGCSILYRTFLESGSLLIMSGSTQEYWLHRVPKEYHDFSPRINFTFRYIQQINEGA